MAIFQDIDQNFGKLGLIAGCAFTTLCLWIGSVLIGRLSNPKAPLVGWKASYEPRFVANLRFFLNPKVILDEGYSKYSTTPFWFARNDANMIVLPNRHVEEIRMLPTDIANPTEAHAHNLIGSVTHMNVILRSNLHFRVIQTKLTPNLGVLAGPLQEELKFALSKTFPACTDQEWTLVHPYHAILDLVARMSARAFVGLPHCRDEKWLEVSTQFTENVFISLLALRTFPTWTHRALSLLLPTIWKNSSYIKRAQRLLVPEIKQMQEQLRNDDAQKIKTNTLLAWLVESADESDNDPNHLAHLAVVISLASIHTTQMNAVHCLSDLAARPEYLEPLRAEIRDAAQSGQWHKSSFSKLRKLDSFMKESQRLNPPSLLSYHRLMKKPYTLSDGTYLPKASHICMPVFHIQNDSRVTPDPDRFDGFRYERLRQNPSETHLHQFATTTADTLNFGHGKYACPGRFFASLEIKSILVRLIANYDIKLPEGQGRPENMGAYEFIFPNPKGEMYFKQRPISEQINFDVPPMDATQPFEV